ncbi:leukocyte cell-derived chemotaxin 1-like [Ptychodera flava]|uniref:leukocyte cell-derived chemotaxin 1-like n=1 Tax=Ptychodera flava TaxID=63121 RepID=UPI00396A22F3
MKTMKSLVIFFVCLFTTAVQSAPADSQVTKEPIKQGIKYTIPVKFEGVNQEETVTIDEEKNVEIFQSIGSDDVEIVEDFDAGIEGMVPKGSDSCYVRPLDMEENIPPNELKLYIENRSQNKSQEDEGTRYKFYTLAGNAIKNRSVVGDTIAEKCEGRDIFWLKPLPHGEHARHKRGCSYSCGCRASWSGISCGCTLRCSW